MSRHGSILTNCLILGSTSVTHVVGLRCHLCIRLAPPQLLFHIGGKRKGRGGRSEGRPSIPTPPQSFRPGRIDCRPAGNSPTTLARPAPSVMIIPNNIRR